MTMDQVKQVMAGWTGKRVRYSVGGRDAWEMWEFRRDGDMPAADSPEKPVGVSFRNGAVIVSTQKRPSANTT